MASADASAGGGGRGTRQLYYHWLLSLWMTTMTAPRPLATCSLMLPPPLLLLLLAARTASAMSVDSVFPSTGSMAGGTFLTIHGTGFQMPTDANLWDAQQVRALACLARERQTRAADDARGQWVHASASSAAHHKLLPAARATYYSEHRPFEFHSVRHNITHSHACRYWLARSSVTSTPTSPPSRASSAARGRFLTTRRRSAVRGGSQPSRPAGCGSPFRCSAGSAAYHKLL
eukprot:COSAG01_NODE_222_length_21420_cov_30.616763_14_plen_232_part_00